MAIDPELTQEYLDALELWQDAGLPVFAVEYAIEPEHVEEAYGLGAENGFITYVTTRPLAMLTETPPPGY
jgi:endo-alpha-1,4-polygalactosaminidase (GH114 family)